MSNDYLWDRSGTPDLDTKQLEELLARVTHDAPLDELRLAKGRRGEPVRATPQEPVAAPRASGRMKGKMNLFDKRIIGAATLTAAAIGLIGVTVYKRRIDSPTPHSLFFVDGSFDNRTDALVHTFAMTPPASPVTPTTGADLAITAGESAFIHVPFGAVDVEIQSKCNAEVEMSVVEATRLERGAHPGDPPTVVVIPAGHADDEPPSDPPMIAGTDSPDGRASTYHLMAGIPPSGMLQYTSRCVGQPPIRGMLIVNHEDPGKEIGRSTNATVNLNNGFYSGDMVTTVSQSMHVFGTVFPGARVSIGAKPIALEPANPSDSLPIGSTFATEVPVSLAHLVVAVRVDDAKGTHFYVMHPSAVVLNACGTTIAEPKQTAAKLDDQGAHAGALKILGAAIAECKPDRDTLSLALTYACKAGDANAASTYWRKIPAELQRRIEPVCASNAIMRDALDKR